MEEKKTWGGVGGTGKEEEKNDKNSGHYVIASSWPPERQPLERRSLMSKVAFFTVTVRWVCEEVDIKSFSVEAELGNLLSWWYDDILLSVCYKA